MKRASLHTLGCRLNQAETAVLESRLRRDGYRVVSFGEPTDLLVVNTCSVTEDAEKTCRYLIRKTLRHSPEAFVAVTGCYAQTGMPQLRTIPGIDLIVGNQYKWDLPAFLPSPQMLKKLPTPEVLHTRTIDRDDFTMPEYGEPDSTRALLKIQDGCNVMCSFCLIPFARGHERSRLVEDVLREAARLGASGYRELVLTGVNIGQYSEGGLDLVRLIERLEGIDGVERIRISSIEPTTVSEALLRLMKSSSTLCPYLHIPLQSGDDEILAAMNRPYRLPDYVALIEKIMREVPHLGLGTDLMVGFPGESDEAFERTFAIAQDLPFSYFHVFPFSCRPGTGAAKLANQIPTSTIRRRVQRLTELSKLKRMAFAEQYIGSTVSVLFESGSIDGLALGVTSNYLKVGVPAREPLTNLVKEVTVTGVSDRWAMGRIATASHQQRTVPVI